MCSTVKGLIAPVVHSGDISEKARCLSTIVFCTGDGFVPLVNVSGNDGKQVKGKK